MKGLVKRTLTGSIIVIALISALLINAITFFLFFLIIQTLGLWEFYTIKYKQEIKPQIVPGISISLVIYSLSYLLARDIISGEYFYVIIPAFIFIFVYELFRNKPTPFNNIAFTFLGMILVSVPFSLFHFIVFEPSNNGFYPELLLVFFILLWSQDTGAYLSGSFFGKHPLLKRVSPKKTIEGLIGGTTLSVIVAFISAHYFNILQTPHLLIIAVIIAIFSTLSDLTESLLKRSANIKDTSNILPGHGGILDRFDGVLFSFPMVFAYIKGLL